jgi:hypothetical protein
MKTVYAIVLLTCLSTLSPVHAETPAADAVRIPAAKSPTRKPTLPVSIATRLPDHISAGENLTLSVNVTSALEQGELVIAFVPDDGLALVSPQQELQFTLSGGVFRTTIPLTVVPSQDGRYAVTVDIRHVVNGRSRGVARGITFRVGDKPVVAAKSGAVSTGDKVISMPARETITRHPR